MCFGANIQYLRRQHGSLTQEQLAEAMGVSRQTVSKWEAGEAYPEMERILRLCALFNCSMDEIMRTDMQGNEDVFSPVRIQTLDRFRMARYVMITPQPENDVRAYLQRWAQQSGLLAVRGYEPVMIGWDFPFVTPEQRTVHSLRGYVAAYVVPEAFEPLTEGVQFAWQERMDYAVITVRDPFAAAFARIPAAYKRIMQHLDRNGIHKGAGEGLTCFERVFEKDGVCCMDVYIAVDAAVKAPDVHRF